MSELSNEDYPYKELVFNVDTSEDKSININKITIQDSRNTIDPNSNALRFLRNKSTINNLSNDIEVIENQTDTLIDVGPRIIETEESSSTTNNIELNDLNIDTPISNYHKNKLDQLEERDYPNTITKDVNIPSYSTDGDYKPNIITGYIDPNYKYNSRMLQLDGQVMNSALYQIAESQFLLQQPVDYTVTSKITSKVVDHWNDKIHTIMNVNSKNFIEYRNGSNVALNNLTDNTNINHIIFSTINNLNIPIEDTEYRIMNCDFELYINDWFTKTKIITSNVSVSETDIIEIRYEFDYNEYLKKAFGDDYNSKISEDAKKIENAYFSMYTLFPSDTTYKYSVPESIIGYVDFMNILKQQEECFEFKPTVYLHHTRYFNLFNALINNMKPSEYTYKILKNIQTTITTVDYEIGKVENLYANQFSIESAPLTTNSLYRNLYLSDYSDIVSYVYETDKHNIIPKERMLKLEFFYAKSKIDNLDVAELYMILNRTNSITNGTLLIAKKFNKNDFVQTTDQHANLYVYEYNNFTIYSFIENSAFNTAPLKYNYRDQQMKEYYETEIGIVSTGFGLTDENTIIQRIGEKSVKIDMAIGEYKDSDKFIINLEDSYVRKPTENYNYAIFYDVYKTSSDKTIRCAVKSSIPEANVSNELVIDVNINNASFGKLNDNIIDIKYNLTKPTLVEDNLVIPINDRTCYYGSNIINTESGIAYVSNSTINIHVKRDLDRFRYDNVYVTNITTTATVDIDMCIEEITGKEEPVETTITISEPKMVYIFKTSTTATVDPTVYYQGEVITTYTTIEYENEGLIVNKNVENVYTYPQITHYYNFEPTTIQWTAMEITGINPDKTSSEVIMYFRVYNVDTIQYKAIGYYAKDKNNILSIESSIYAIENNVSKYKAIQNCVDEIEENIRNAGVATFYDLITSTTTVTSNNLFSYTDNNDRLYDRTYIYNKILDKYEYVYYGDLEANLYTCKYSYAINKYKFKQTVFKTIYSYDIGKVQGILVYHFKDSYHIAGESIIYNDIIINYLDDKWKLKNPIVKTYIDKFKNEHSIELQSIYIRNININSINIRALVSTKETNTRTAYANNFLKMNYNIDETKNMIQIYNNNYQPIPNIKTDLIINAPFKDLKTNYDNLYEPIYSNPNSVVFNGYVCEINQSNMMENYTYKVNRDNILMSINANTLKDNKFDIGLNLIFNVEYPKDEYGIFAYGNNKISNLPGFLVSESNTVYGNLDNSNWGINRIYLSCNNNMCTGTITASNFRHTSNDYSLEKICLLNIKPQYYIQFKINVNIPIGALNTDKPIVLIPTFSAYLPGKAKMIVVQKPIYLNITLDNIAYFKETKNFEDIIEISSPNDCISVGINVDKFELPNNFNNKFGPTFNVGVNGFNSLLHYFKLKLNNINSGDSEYILLNPCNSECCKLEFASKKFKFDIHAIKTGYYELRDGETKKRRCMKYTNKGEPDTEYEDSIYNWIKRSELTSGNVKISTTIEIKGKYYNFLFNTTYAFNILTTIFTRQYVSYPNSYPYNYKVALKGITKNNYETTLSVLFSNSPCSRCTKNCCQCMGDAIIGGNNNNVDTDFDVNIKTGSMCINRSNLKYTPIYITTMVKDSSTILTNGVIKLINGSNLIEEVIYTISQDNNKNMINLIIKNGNGEQLNNYMYSMQKIEVNHKGVVNIYNNKTVSTQGIKYLLVPSRTYFTFWVPLYPKLFEDYSDFNVVIDTISITSAESKITEEQFANSPDLLSTTVYIKDVDTSGNNVNGNNNSNSEYYLDTIYIPASNYTTIDELCECINNKFYQELSDNIVTENNTSMTFKGYTRTNLKMPLLVALTHINNLSYNIYVSNYNRFDYFNKVLTLSSEDTLTIIGDNGTKLIKAIAKPNKTLKLDFSGKFDLNNYFIENPNFILSYDLLNPIGITFNDYIDDLIINDNMIYNMLYNKKFIKHSKEGVRDKYTFAENIIPVEFDTEFIPESVDYEHQLEPCQNYMISIGNDIMLKANEANKIDLTVSETKDYIKNYYQYNHFSMQFKQKSKSAWWNLGIIPMKISYDYIPKIKNDSNIFSVDSPDIYLAFHKLYYYHYLCSYFNETKYFNNVLTVPTKIIINGEVQKNININESLFKNTWIGSKKYLLMKPNKFMIRYTTNNNIGYIVNSNASEGSQMINVNSVEFDNDNHTIILIVNSQINVENIDKLYLYIDSNFSHYPFEFGTNAKLEYDKIKL